MRKFISVSILLGGWLHLAAQDSLPHKPYSLKDCIDIAIHNNPDVVQKQYLAASNKVSWQQAKDNVFPTVNASVSHTLYNGRSINSYTNTYINQSYTSGYYELYSSFTLWNGSSIQNYIKKCALDYKAAELEAQQARDQLTFQVILNYLAVLAAKEQLDIALRQAEVTQENVKALNIKYAEGVVGLGDISDIKGQYANNELTIITKKNTLENARLAMAQSLNIPYDSTMQLEAMETMEFPQEYPSSAEDIYVSAAQKLAVVKVADTRLASAFKNIQYIKGQAMPSLVLSGGAYTNYSSAATTSSLVSTGDVLTDSYVLSEGNKLQVYSPQNNYATEKISYGSQWKNNINTAVSLSLQIPIFNRFQLRNKLKQAKLDRQQADYTVKTLRTQLHQAVESDYMNMKFSFLTFQKLTQQVAEFKKSMQVATVKLDNGVTTTVDYIIAKNNLDQANMNLIAAKYDYILRTKILDYYLGAF